MLYYDVRGVARKYDVAFEADGFTWSRDAPQFAQRFRVTISKDGDNMEGRGHDEKTRRRMGVGPSAVVCAGGEMTAETSAERWFIAPYFLVPDVVAAAHFYRDTFGFSFERFWGEPPSFCMVQRGGIVIMLAQIQDPALVQPNSRADREGGAWDAYVWVRNADALYAEFISKGAKIARAICDQEYGCRDFDVLDLNGYRLCFGQNLR